MCLEPLQPPGVQLKLASLPVQDGLFTHVARQLSAHLSTGDLVRVHSIFALQSRARGHTRLCFRNNMSTFSFLRFGYEVLSIG